jgi:hypothetical protein
LFGIHAQTVLDLFMPVMMFLILRLLLRRTWAAIGVVSFLVVVMINPAPGMPTPGFLLGIGLGITIFWVTFLRLGFLCLFVAFSITDFLQILPLTLEFSSWHAGPTILYLLLMIGVAVYGFRISLAGRPLLRDQLAEAQAPAGP